MSSVRPLKRYLCQWGFTPDRSDELGLQQGDVVLVAEEFRDGWMRGLRLRDLQVGFFPAAFVKEDVSPIYTLKNTGHLVDDITGLLSGSNKRSRIALEICESEKTYLQKLQLLHQKYVEGLRAQLKLIISSEDYSVLFSPVQPLITLSETMVAHLVSRMEAWDNRNTQVGDLFLHMEEHLKWFDSYAVQNPIATQVLSKLCLQDKFMNWLKKAQEETNCTLNSLLLEPVQRVPRYELLLKELVKHTPEDHPDYTNLQNAVILIQKINNDCNENLGKVDNELKLLATSKKFPEDDVHLIHAESLINKGKKNAKKNSKDRGSMNFNPQMLEKVAVSNYATYFESEHHRVYVMEGPIMKARHNNFHDVSERYLFLTSDVILIAQAFNKSRRAFKLKERVMLLHAWITDTIFDDQRLPSCGFILGTHNNVYRFLAASDDEKNSWFTTLHKMIFAQKQLFSKLLTHLSIPDEIFMYCAAKPRLHYIGMNTNELTFKAGDTVNVIGFKDMEDKWHSGLFSDEMFDPSSEWLFGYVKETFGWFPRAYVLGSSGKILEPSPEELHHLPMSYVLAIKKRYVELTQRQIPPLTEDERYAKVIVGDETENIKIASNSTIQDIIQLHYGEIFNNTVHWLLIEESLDGSVARQLEANEDPSYVVDFWGKSKDKMIFRMIQGAMTH